MAVWKMSEALYVVTCQEIGTPELVASRRDIVDIKELLENKKNNWARTMFSGSHREGFRLLLYGSDVDIMIWRTEHRVIWDFSQSEYYNTDRHTIILCNSSESPPGFTLLWLSVQCNDNLVLPACVEMNGRLYLSSSKCREFRRNSFTPDCREHGPCSTGTCTFGTTKLPTANFDIAHCFVSDFWPPLASSWRDRCHSWPPPHVVNDIVRNGCHFVAKGHKLGNHEDKEWMISFYQAECKLVYSMNHTQFLTYGLLKFFLKEIINNGLRDEDQLLSSYHIKTSVFWAIQQNTLPHWCPQNLLAGFWVCFKLILKWVYEGICPNFFIPQNNLFLSKIHGQAQTTLFGRLYGLYEKGLALLLHIPLIRSSIIDVFCNPRHEVFTSEHTLISEADFDVNLFNEIHKNDVLPTSDLHDITGFLHTVEQLIDSPLTQYQLVLLQKITATIFQRTAFTLHNMYTNTGGNKHMYIADKISCHLLKLTAKFGFISDHLYIVMYYYRTFRYREALSVIEIIKVKLAQPYLMYRRRVDRERYTEAVRGWSLSKKMRQAVLWDIKLETKIYYIDELIPEQSSSQDTPFILNISPFVLLHMLEFLCSRNLETRKAKTALDDLTALIHNDQEEYIHRTFRDIAWEILGICHQITGNLQAALDSYRQSLWQLPYHRIETVTKKRIHDLQMPT